MLIYKDWSDACANYLSSDSLTFAFQYDFEVKMFCEAKIVNHLQIKCLDDFAGDYVSMIFSPKSPHIEGVARLTEFLRIQEMRHLFEKQKVFAVDIPPTTYTRAAIATKSLQLLFLLYFSLLILCTGVFFFEILFH